MAARNFNNVMSIDQKEIYIPGSFAPNGTSAIDATKTKGKGFSVARTGVGTFVVTLQDGFPKINAVVASLQLNTAAGLTVIATGGLDPVTARTATFTLWDNIANAAADLAANDNNRIHFCLFMKNSNLP